MGGNSLAEKRVFGSGAGAIDQLIGDDDVAGGHFLAQAADGAHGNEPTNIERAQRPNIRAMIDFMGEQAVADSMPWQETHTPPIDPTGHHRVGWVTKRSLDRAHLDLVQAIYFIQSTAANDADCAFSESF
jgi:hypothetical protein